MVIAPLISKSANISTVSNKSEQKPGLMVFILLLIIIFFLIFYFGFRKKSQKEEVGGTAPKVKKMISLKEIKFDTDVLKTEKFKELRTFGEVPIKTEGEGRANPFSTY